MDALERKLQEVMLENQQLVGNRRFYPRQLHLERIEGKATVITGIRRAGKTVYEMLYMQELLGRGVDRENLCILDFSDDRLLALRSREPSVVADAYYDFWPEKSKEKVYFFFDEIQYLPHWELLVNRLQNTRSCEIKIPGSSAKLLVKDCDGTGRPQPALGAVSFFVPRVSCNEGRGSRSAPSAGADR